MEKNIFLIRHGQTELNRQRIIQGSGVNVGLNDLGNKQSQAFYQYYKDHPFELVYCSELIRSQQTIKPFIELGIPIIKTDLINEISWGSQEGKVSTEESISEYKSVVESWSMGNLEARVGGGESAKELQERCLAFKEEILARQEREILICSHGRTMRCLNCVFSNLPLSYMDKFTHSNTGLYKFSLAKGEIRRLLENDISHLDEIVDSW